MGIVINFNLSAQSGTLFPKLDPRASGGYTFWDNIEGADYYKVHAMYKNSENNYITVGMTSSENNFYKFDPLFFQLPNAYFQIKAFNSSNMEIDNSDIIFCTYVGFTPLDYLCEKICNGTSYAYRMSAYENPTNSSITILTEEVPKYANTTLALSIPYWQAIDINTWNAISVNHPYKYQFTNAPNYIHFKIGTPAASGLIGPFYDKTNSVITDGYLIEKKMDQFKHFSGQTTPPLTYSNFCSNALVGAGSSWLNIYNQHVSAVQYPTVANPFTNSVVSDLGCISSYGNPNGGPSGGGNTQPWGVLLDSIYDVLFGFNANINSNPYNPIWADFELAVDGLSNFQAIENTKIVGFNINNVLSDASVSYFRNNINDPLILSESNGDLIKGLYSMLVFTSNGEALPFYFEINKDIPKPKDKEFLDVLVAPNPVTNDNLKILLNSNIDLSVNLYVHNMNGTLINSQLKNIVSGITENVQIDISSFNLSSTELMVSVICADGSTIQKFALIP